MLYQHFLDVELRAVLFKSTLLVKQFHRRLRGYEQQCLEADRAFDGKMQVIKRFAVIACHKLVEFVDLLILQFAFGTLPERGDAVHLSAGQPNREIDKIRVFFDHLLKPVLFGKLLELLLERKRYRGTTFSTLDRFNGIGALSRRTPAPPFRCSGCCTSRFNSHLIGHHENRVKTDTELADKVAINTRIARFLLQGFHKAKCARLCNRTKVCNQLLFAHADSAVFDHKGSLFGINGYGDSQLCVPVEGTLIGQHGKSDLAQCIGGIGNQFTEKNFRMGI